MAFDDMTAACIREVAELESRLEHTRYWYSTRMKVLEEWARTELPDDLKTRFFSIVANGSPSPYEHPDYAGQYNLLKHRAEKAEAELVRLRASGVAASANDALIDAADKHADNYEGHDIPARDVRAAICNAFYAGSRFAAVGARGDGEALATALAKGYTGSTFVTDFHGPKVTLRYSTNDEAERAYAALCDAIDTANGVVVGSNPQSLRSREAGQLAWDALADGVAADPEWEHYPMEGIGMVRRRRDAK